MNSVSVELIPRSVESLESEVALVKAIAPLVNTINIPDLLRFDIRSWEAVSITSKTFSHSIPHIRAMDFPSNNIKEYLETSELSKHLLESEIPAVLVVKGDKPKKSNKQIFDTDSTTLIKAMKEHFPNIKVYGAIDQYRSTIEKEMDYTAEKIDAGADGFFTQPFFNLNSMEDYANYLNKSCKSTEIFWGVSPVCTERSKNYWVQENKVSFEDDFDLTLEGNIKFAKQALNFIKQENSNIYLMPITVDLKEYLLGVF